MRDLFVFVRVYVGFSFGLAIIYYLKFMSIISNRHLVGLVEFQAIRLRVRNRSNRGEVKQYREHVLQ